MRPVATYRVSESQAGQRLDLFLKDRIPRLSRSAIQGAIKDRVTLPERAARPKPSLLLSQGDIVVVNPAEVDEPPFPDELIPRVIHLDDHIIAVDKPAGLAVHASRQAVENHLVGWLRRAHDDPAISLGHRIDRETSGIVVSTRNTPAAQWVGLEFASRRVHKEYIAIVRGVTEETFTVDTPIGSDVESTIFIKQWTNSTEGAPSKTRFVRERILSDGEHSLVRAFPETGRRHQIRVHLASIGHPIVGDKLYSQGDRFFLHYITHGLDERRWQMLGAPRQLLHAAVLELSHPATENLLRLEAPTPTDFINFEKSVK